jgi:hypothetical protein
MTPSAEVAQSAERGTENPCVGGSIPSLGKIIQPLPDGGGFVL